MQPRWRVRVAVNINGDGAGLRAWFGIQDHLADKELSYIGVLRQVAALFERHGGANSVGARIGVVNDCEAKTTVVRLDVRANRMSNAQLVLVASNHVDHANLADSSIGKGNE